MDRTFEATYDGGTLCVRGDVDDYGIIALRNRLADHGSAAGQTLVVELSDVDYLPSVAVGVLTRALGTADRVGARIELVARRGTVAQRVLMVCALPYCEEIPTGVGPDADVPA